MSERNPSGQPDATPPSSTGGREPSADDRSAANREIIALIPKISTVMGEFINKVIPYIKAHVGELPQDYLDDIEDKILNITLDLEMLTSLSVTTGNDVTRLRVAVQNTVDRVNREIKSKTGAGSGNTPPPPDIVAPPVVNSPDPTGGGPPPPPEPPAPPVEAEPPTGPDFEQELENIRISLDSGFFSPESAKDELEQLVRQRRAEFQTLDATTRDRILVIIRALRARLQAPQIPQPPQAPPIAPPPDINRNAERNIDDLSDEDLVEEMMRQGVDPAATSTVYVDPGGSQYRRDLWTEFHNRFGVNSRDTSEVRQYKLEWWVYAQVHWAKEINEEEGQVPSCVHSKLFPELTGKEGRSHRKLEREQLLQVTTFHPIYGEYVRKILQEIIEKVADKKNREFSKYDRKNYEYLCGSGEGRSLIDNYISDHYRNTMMLNLYQDLNEDERGKKIDRILKLTLNLFLLFDLLSVSLAERQTQTTTRIHGMTVKEDDWIWLSRPDAATVHRIQRYNILSDWSAWWLVVQSEVPRNYGRNGQPEYHKQLEKIRDKLKLQQECYYPTDSFSGEANGIPPSSILEPTFPDTFGFLTLQKGEMLVFGNEVWGFNRAGEYQELGTVTTRGKYRGPETDPGDGDEIKSVWTTDNYQLALSAWKDMLLLVLGDLPQKITEEMLFESYAKGDDGKEMGLLDTFVKGGPDRMKLFPGNHQKALQPLLTWFLLRVIARLAVSEQRKTYIHKEIVERLRGTYKSGGGLESFTDQIDGAIRAISNGTNGTRMGDCFKDPKYLRRGNRKIYADCIYKEKKMSIPAPVISHLLPAGQTQEEYKKYRKIVDGLVAIPDPGVSRVKSMVRIDEQGGKDSH
ncbi:MAG: hypothetical protein ABII10_00905 [Candidatus Paceibacterota bacterium]